MEYYTPSKWKDCGNYFIYEDDQKTIGWKQARMGRPTGTTITSCTSTDPDVVNDIALQIAKLKETVILREEQKKIDFGILNEVNARNWYISTYNNIVKEIGFAVPKFDPRVGMSPDGLVVDNQGNSIGLIEIKCPTHFYNLLDEYLKAGRPFTDDYKHIYRSHYNQMQMGMAVFNVEWCDYIVYCIPENRVFIERVYRNRAYWDDIYLKIVNFIETILNPLLKSIGSKYPLIPPSLIK